MNRIFSPKNTLDILLKIRADSVIDNIRISRVFAKRASFVEEEKWTLTGQFDDSIFAVFRDSIADQFKQCLNAINFGTLFTDRPNAYCIKTEFGPLVMFSEALYTYLYYVTISFAGYWKGFGDDIKTRTVEQSLLIAVRTMILAESFDFELDPRGTPPESLNAVIKNVVRKEMLFIIAHEYAHFWLKHLDNNKLKDEDFSLYLLDNISGQRKPESPLTLSFYTVEQEQEFQADRLAIDILCEAYEDRGDILLTAISVLLKIQLFESFANLLRKGKNESSHPPSLERCQQLLKSAKTTWNKEQVEQFESLKAIVGKFETSLSSLFQRDPTLFTNYGSAYLDQWKIGKMKRDRLDY